MKLTALSVKNAPDGKHFDGNGLELRKKDGAGSWVWRYSFAGSRREMGLGSYPSVSLSDARKERDRWKSILSQGNDPITERKAQIEVKRLEIAKTDPPLEDLVNEVFESLKATLVRGGKAGRWMTPLRKHVLPKIGRKPVSTIHQSDIKAAIAPIWRAKHETAKKAVNRLRIVFRQGKLTGYDCDPFTVDAAIHMLGAVLHVSKPLAATPWQDLPEMFARFENRGTAPSCLRFIMLTAVRGTPARGARFDEIEDDVWTVPAERMKGRVGQTRDFRVPLSAAALQIVDERRAFGSEYLFAGPCGKPITDAMLGKFMRDNKEDGTPHGLRTSFRTWCQDTEPATYDVCETALAHTVGGKVERAYARSDLLDRRRILMNKWADHVTGKVSEHVIPLRSR